LKRLSPSLAWENEVSSFLPATCTLPFQYRCKCRRNELLPASVSWSRLRENEDKSTSRLARSEHPKRVA